METCFSQMKGFGMFGLWVVCSRPMEPLGPDFYLGSVLICDESKC